MFITYLNWWLAHLISLTLHINYFNSISNILVVHNTNSILIMQMADGQFVLLHFILDTS